VASTHHGDLMHSDASDLPVRWPAWHSAADRDDLLNNVRRWHQYTFARTKPCPVCAWPFEANHLCLAPDPFARESTDE
jgi:hypothetical protein